MLGIFARRVGQILRGLGGRDPAGLRLGLQTLIAFLPAAVIGLLLKEKIDQYLFGLWPVVAAWFVGGLAILWAVRSPRLGREAAGKGNALEKLNWAAQWQSG